MSRSEEEQPEDRPEEQPEEQREYLTLIHNQISSTNNISKTKNLIKRFPQVLSYQIEEWGGSIALHTVCSRQPQNYELIKLLVEEGLKSKGCNFSSKDRGGLLCRDSFNQTPLSILVAHNAIETMRFLLRNDPPWLEPSDVVHCRLFDYVHSTYHIDMVRFLIQLYPQCISNCNVPSGGDGGVSSNSSSISTDHDTLLIYHLCGKIRDSRLLLRVVSLLMEEGIKQNIVGGSAGFDEQNEYGLGGLFVIHGREEQSELRSAADILREQRHQSWGILYPIIVGVIGGSTMLNNEVPLLLHGAIMAGNYRRIEDICKNVHGSARVRDCKRRLPIHLAAEQGLRWNVDRMDVIARANIDATKEKDPVTGLPICALAAEGEKPSLTSIFELVLLNLDEFIIS